MPKNIVFCADGTWNGPDKDENEDGVPDLTNVLRLYDSLAGEPHATHTEQRNGRSALAEQEKWLPGAASPVQVAKYIHGVGDSENLIKRVLGGVFGEGFVKRIVRGYTFISRNHEPGDRIYLVGFSRGAYTVRALAGMIASQGLLKLEAMQLDGEYDAEEAYRKGIYVWTEYRRAAGKRTTLLSVFEQFRKKDVPAEQRLPLERIAAVAVWDTVGSLGVPIYKDREGDPVDVFRFADENLSPKVALGLHAVSIDEEREHFQPTLWNPRDGIAQVWFAGAHADVGGGYPERNLSDVSLDWMIRRLKKAGVEFRPEVEIRIDDRFIPNNRPWEKSPFDLFGHGPRRHPPYAIFHASVAQRLTKYADQYAPASLRHILDKGPMPPGMIASDD